MFSHVFTNPKEDCSCSSFQATNEPTLAKQLKSAWDLGRRSEKGGESIPDFGHVSGESEVLNIGES